MLNRIHRLFPSSVLFLLLGGHVLLMGCEKSNEEKLIGSWEINAYEMTYWGSWVNLKSPEEIEYYETGAGGCYYTAHEASVAERKFEFKDDNTFTFHLNILVVPWEFCDWTSGPDVYARTFNFVHSGTWELMEAGDGYDFGERVKLYLHPCGEYYQVWSLDNISNRKIRAGFYTQGKEDCHLPLTQWTGNFEAKAD